MSRRIAALLISLFLPSTLLAQGCYLSTDPADRLVPGASLGNPSLNAITVNQISLGLETYNMGALNGALNIRNLFLTYTSPSYLPRGFGLGLESFSTGMFSRHRLNFSYGRRITRSFLLGAQVGWHNIGFSGFSGEEFDTNDPLLGNNSKSTFTLGLGCYWRPLERLRLAGAVYDLNRPEISLTGGNGRLPMRYQLGASLSFANFSPFFRIGNINTYLENPGFFDDDVTYSLGIRYNILSDNAIAAGIHEGQYALGGSLALTPTTQLHARYSYATPELRSISWGGAMFAFSWDLFRNRRLSIPPMLPVPLPNQHRISGFDQPESADRGEFFLFSPIRHLDRTRIEIVRDIDFNLLHRTGTTYLPLYALVPHDESGSMVDVQSTLPDSLNSVEVTMREQGIQLPDQWGFSSAYLTEMLGTRNAIAHDDLNADVVVMDSDALPRALVLADIMETNYGDVDIRALADSRGNVSVASLEAVVERLGNEVIDYLSHGIYRIWILPVHMDNYSGSWLLEIRDGLDTTVKQWKGRGLPPANIDWDWKVNDRFIGPGSYRVLFTYDERGGAGSGTSSREVSFAVDLTQRTQEISIRNTVSDPHLQPQRKTFIIGHNNIKPLEE